MLRKGVCLEAGPSLVSGGPSDKVVLASPACEVRKSDLLVAGREDSMSHDSASVSLRWPNPRNTDASCGCSLEIEAPNAKEMSRWADVVVEMAFGGSDRDWRR